MKVIHTDVLVIGGGLAGLRLGIGAKRRGHDVIILSLVPPKRSHSAAAQGGMQASLANVIKGQGDTEVIHFEDTVRGSDWGADQKVVRMFVNTAPKAVRELAAWGVPWSRVRKGDRTVIINGQPVTITERSEAHGLRCRVDEHPDHFLVGAPVAAAHRVLEVDVLGVALSLDHVGERGLHPALCGSRMRALRRHQRQDQDIVAAALGADRDAQPGEPAADHQHVGVEDLHRAGATPLLGAALGVAAFRCAGT